MNSSLAQFWERFKNDHEQIEKIVSESNGPYAGLSLEALYSSPEDLSHVFRHPLITGTFVDLGCGSGFSALLYGTIFPDRSAIGVEIEEARLKRGFEYLRHHPEVKVTLIQGDLLSCALPVAETYFLYFPTGPVLDRILFELYKLNKEFKLLVIESHGDLIKRIELENWLTFTDEVPLNSLRHHPSARIYVRNFSERKESLEVFNHSYQDHYIVIQEKNETWLGRTLGMEWTSGDRFELLSPPRTIFWKDVKKLMLSMEECEEVYFEAIDLWNKGEITLTTADKIYRGFIRKIIISPSFKVEISSGEKVEWDKILKITPGT